jgi:hypothetical protein
MRAILRAPPLPSQLLRFLIQHHPAGNIPLHARSLRSSDLLSARLYH